MKIWCSDWGKFCVQNESCSLRQGQESSQNYCYSARHLISANFEFEGWPFWACLAFQIGMTDAHKRSEQTLVIVQRVQNVIPSQWDKVFNYPVCFSLATPAVVGMGRAAVDSGVHSVCTVCSCWDRPTAWEHWHLALVWLQSPFEWPGRGIDIWHEESGHSWTKDCSRHQLYTPFSLFTCLVNGYLTESNFNLQPQSIFFKFFFGLPATFRKQLMWAPALITWVTFETNHMPCRDLAPAAECRRQVTAYVSSIQVRHCEWKILHLKAKEKESRPY